MLSVLLLPVLCVGSFLVGAAIFYGIGRVAGIDRAVAELRLHQEQQRLKSSMIPDRVDNGNDPSCTFCQFVRKNIPMEEMSEEDQRNYRSHLLNYHGLAV